MSRVVAVPEVARFIGNVCMGLGQGGARCVRYFPQWVLCPGTSGCQRQASVAGSQNQAGLVPRPAWRTT